MLNKLLLAFDTGLLVASILCLVVDSLNLNDVQAFLEAGNLLMAVCIVVKYGVHLFLEASNLWMEACKIGEASHTPSWENQAPHCWVGGSPNQGLDNFGLASLFGVVEDTAFGEDSIQKELFERAFWVAGCNLWTKSFLVEAVDILYLVG